MIEVLDSVIRVRVWRSFACRSGVIGSLFRVSLGARKELQRLKVKVLILVDTGDTAICHYRPF
ncbi:hypothetical protein Hanom_Chr17g01540151 [Helianthus anomalus]